MAEPGELLRAYNKAKQDKKILVGHALYIVLDHFEHEKDHIAATKGKRGARISFPLAGGWELVKEWDYSDIEEE